MTIANQRGQATRKQIRVAILNRLRWGIDALGQEDAGNMQFPVSYINDQINSCLGEMCGTVQFLQKLRSFGHTDVTYPANTQTVSLDSLGVLDRRIYRIWLRDYADPSRVLGVIPQYDDNSPYVYGTQNVINGLGPAYSWWNVAWRWQFFDNGAIAIQPIPGRPLNLRLQVPGNSFPQFFSDADKMPPNIDSHVNVEQMLIMLACARLDPNNEARHLGEYQRILNNSQQALFPNDEPRGKLLGW